MPIRSPVVRWLIVGTLLFAVILVPFAFIGDPLEAFVRRSVVAEEGNDAILALTIVFLLSADILLPIPSSIVSTAAGYRFGAIGGAGLSLLGLTISCWFGYWIGSSFGRVGAERMVGARRLNSAARVIGRYGSWSVALARPVPVLAEASVILAGLLRLPFIPFFVLSTLANLIVSLVYGFAGSLSAEVDSLLLGLAAAVSVPFLASWWLHGRAERAATFDQ
jgi:uncharacterized membrane protein YdjX (TVP38/TMEM64 family)